jgi:hypothetical protein
MFFRSSRAALLRGAAPCGTRGVYHIPALIGASKVAALYVVKKVAFTKVLQKFGPTQAVTSLRELNAALRRKAMDSYPPALADATEKGLDTLEASLAGLRGQNKVQAVWTWYDRLEKDNPTLFHAVLKTYTDTLPGMKWAYAVLKGDAAVSGRTASRSGAATSIDANASVAARAAAAEAADALGPTGEALLERLHAGHPELRNYHVILVPKGGGAGAERAE